MIKDLKTYLISIVATFMLLANVLLPQTAFAAVNASCNKSFLGLPTWYAYLEVVPANSVSINGVAPPASASGCVILKSAGGTPIEGIDDVFSVMPLVLIALLDLLLRVAGIVAFFYVVLSGFKFVFAQGNPDKEKQARNALFNAVIGMLISMSAAFVVAFVGKRLGG
jgi:hypothetical protein